MKLKKIVAICMISFVAFVGMCSVSAANTLPPTSYKTTWNIEDIWYYLDSTAVGYSGTISGAANNWVHTGHGYNKLYPNTRTTNKYNSAIDFYSTNGPKNSYVAQTTLFKRVNGNPVVVLGKMYQIV